MQRLNDLPLILIRIDEFCDQPLCLNPAALQLLLIFHRDRKLCSSRAVHHPALTILSFKGGRCKRQGIDEDFIEIQIFIGDHRRFALTRTNQIADQQSGFHFTAHNITALADIAADLLEFLLRPVQRLAERHDLPFAA